MEDKPEDDDDSIGDVRALKPDSRQIGGSPVWRGWWGGSLSVPSRRNHQQAVLSRRAPRLEVGLLYSPGKVLKHGYVVPVEVRHGSQLNGKI